MKAIQNFIGGEFRPPASDEWLDNPEPATGQAYSRVPDSGPGDVDAAVSAASEAFPGWSATSAAERSRLLLDIAARIESRLEMLARAESIDNGKPLALARAVDIPRAAENFRFFATAILHGRSDLHDMDGRALNYTLRAPVGVAGLISPWNLPLYLLTWKIAPALAAGCCAVAKPSEVTPMTAFLLSEICAEAGLPPGVLNIVHGAGPNVGAPLVAHPGVKAVSFTGSTRVGREIARSAGPEFKKLSLEMGGKNPFVVFADANLEQALPECVRAAFANQGQICLCGSRVLVERPIYDEFVAGFLERAKALRPGDPLDEATSQGALVSRAHWEKVKACVDLAREEGGDILCGGGPPAEPVSERCAGGWFFEPTLIAGLGSGCRTNQEEIFGPVATIAPFDGEDEALALANGVDYGLAASVWTRDLDRAHRVASRVEAGVVWVNCWMLRDLRTPFGGMKQSGVGREGGDEALRFFTEPKNVCVKLG